LPRKLADAIDKLARGREPISGKPGKLALDALALQMQAHVRRSNMSTASSRSASTIAGKADLVIFAPEMLKQHGIDPASCRGDRERGLEALDADSMRLIEHDRGRRIFTEAPEGGEE
jgi:hypothetical protein